MFASPRGGQPISSHKITIARRLIIDERADADHDIDVVKMIAIREHVSGMTPSPIKASMPMPSLADAASATPHARLIDTNRNYGRGHVRAFMRSEDNSADGGQCEYLEAGLLLLSGEMKDRIGSKCLMATRSSAPR